MGSATKTRATSVSASAATAGALVHDAFAGVLLYDGGETAPFPGLPGDDLLAAHSALIETVHVRVIEGEVHLAFLWPCGTGSPGPAHLRVTFLALTAPPARGLQGSVLLSPSGPAHGLTPREFEVLGMMVDGHSNGWMARELTVGTRTIATHVEHILAKLSSPTRTHAAVRAQRAGLYVPHPARPERES